MTSETQAADIHEEIRRLRLRVMSLNQPALDAGARELVRGTLAALSAVLAGGRAVPDLGDRVLPDQLVVLLSDGLPEYGATEEQTRRALELAVELRRALPS